MVSTAEDLNLSLCWPCVISTRTPIQFLNLPFGQVVKLFSFFNRLCVLLCQMYYFRHINITFKFYLSFTEFHKLAENSSVSALPTAVVTRQMLFSVSICTFLKITLCYPCGLVTQNICISSSEIGRVMGGISCSFHRA